MRIAVVPGDGIGQEVVPAALPVLTLLDEAYGLGITHDVLDWGADTWLRTGVGLPEGAIERLTKEYGAVLLGALGDPRIPDMAHGREILLGMRRGLDLYVNHRPVTLPTGVIDIFRENTQGLYVGVGGTVPQGGRTGVAIDECVYTRETVEKFVRYCLGRLRDTGRTKVTLVHKANAVPNTGRLWQEVFRRELEDFPGLEGSEEYVDAFCYHLVRDPSPYQGVLASNLFGDIVSDIGAALMGGLGLAASASICPETGIGLFEPVHGSAPDIAGRGIANPYATVMSLAMLLEHAGHGAPAALLRRCLDEAARGEAATPDLGGKGTTRSFMDAVLALLERGVAARGNDD
ncbi:3-isopropylmalate dehydrogenase [Streptomyces mashuensis]|uniref:3-isopropylmalate dehydrogenase n=1 Tax=Streptomyces mashuensis TaxID=33904 RepID=A0A919ASZ5_9ACTN|nr:isocitrate/isopropylmalate family dehydrogenase [Streptomyces mashuensis]GHF24705.1 3-isopropylmalate dehydrogenase [Streptomyces mashuensis]